VRRGDRYGLDAADEWIRFKALLAAKYSIRSIDMVINWKDRSMANNDSNAGDVLL
jgi:hypothetical protein